MNSLKELNLISVLNNMDEEKLKQIFKKVKCLKISNIIKDTECEICNEYIKYHEKCDFCDDLICEYFCNRNTNERMCIQCTKEVVNSNDLELFHEYTYIQFWTADFLMVFTCDDLILNKDWPINEFIAISYEEFLKFLKNNNIKY